MSQIQIQRQSLTEIIFLLRDAVNPNGRDHGVIQQRLALLNRHPYYYCYLLHILIHSINEDIPTRERAGSLLINNIGNNFNQIQLDVLNYIQQSCINALHQPDIYTNQSISAIISSIMSSLAMRGQVHNFSDMIIDLIYQLDSPNMQVLEIFLDTLIMISEKVPRELDQELKGIHLLDAILTKTINLISHPNHPIRQRAILLSSQFIITKPPTFVRLLDRIMEALLPLSSDTHPGVKKEYGKMVAAILELFPEKLSSHLHPVIEYMVNATTDPNVEMALIASDFWLKYAQQEYYYEELIPYLPRLVKALLKILVYSEKELQALAAEDGDADDPINIFTVNETMNHHYTPKSRIKSSHSVNTKKEYSDSDDMYSDDSDYVQNALNIDSLCITEKVDYDDDEFYSEETLRTSCGTTIEALSGTYGATIASIILKELRSHTLYHEDWVIRESGILALGATAEGGTDPISEHMPELIPYLLKSMNDPKPAIRSISCWTVSRFSRWLATQCNKDKSNIKKYFEPVLLCILQRLLESNQAVQSCACAALVTLEEAATSLLIPYIKPILVHLNNAFAIYKGKSLELLYEAMRSFADSVQCELNQEPHISILMPPLIAKWNQLADDDPNLDYLLECLSPITLALGPGFIQFVEPVLTRCTKLIESTLQGQALADKYPDEMLPPNVDSLIAALKLLSGIVRGLGPKIEPFVSQTSPPLLSLLLTCIKDPVSEVLQITFLLIGDIAVAQFSLLMPYIHPFICGIIQVLQNEEYFVSKSVFNNALWALGEIVLRWGNEIRPYIPKLMDVLVRLLIHRYHPSAVNENAMITIGRLGAVAPKDVAPYVSYFMRPWLEISLSVEEGEEKDTAFQGLCAIIEYNSTDVQDELLLLLVTISSWKTPSPQLLAGLINITKGLHRTTEQEKWDMIYAQLNPQQQKMISDKLSD
ncbi:armadillo-type protein [Pilobolus umbonatus]|nr:armadillo-type protein [Pilobolus umbonatus]